MRLPAELGVYDKVSKKDGAQFHPGIVEIW